MPVKKDPPIRAKINSTAGEKMKVQLLQKEWGWSYDQIFTYAFKAGLKTMNVNKFPEEER